MLIKDLPGWEDRYAVSDDGRVWSKFFNRWLKPFVNHSGYLKVSLSGREKRVRVFVHRLVCTVFHGPAPTPAHQVDHINGNHADNRAVNLRWVTIDENLANAEEIGIGKAKRPVVAFNVEGDVLHFESIMSAKRYGFTNVRRCLVDRRRLCHGYAFVFESEWPTFDVDAYFAERELRGKQLQRGASPR